jgi:hypothetical protein
MKWQVNKMASWWNDKLTKWHIDEMARCQKDLAPEIMSKFFFANPFFISSFLPLFSISFFSHEGGIEKKFFSKLNLFLKR